MFFKIKTIRGPSAAGDISVLLDIAIHPKPEPGCWETKRAWLFCSAGLQDGGSREINWLDFCFLFVKIYGKMMEVWPCVAEWSHTDTDTLQLLDDADTLQLERLKLL